MCADDVSYLRQWATPEEALEQEANRPAIELWLSELGSKHCFGSRLCDSRVWHVHGTLGLPCRRHWPVHDRTQGNMQNRH
mmetsp:Transcript_21957/g.29729  ORF Transcript_21957/g.29729 Transcript_21957/m.29729 type:complete len:80 (-) Transcript_21957:16-255(-)